MLIAEKIWSFSFSLNKSKKKSGLKPNICLLKLLLKNKRHEMHQFYLLALQLFCGQTHKVWPKLSWGWRWRMRIRQMQAGKSKHTKQEQGFFLLKTFHRDMEENCGLKKIFDWNIWLKNICWSFGSSSTHEKKKKKEIFHAALSYRDGFLGVQ